MSVIKISKDYTVNPGARYYDDGPFSGEDFFHLVLDKSFKSALDNHEKLTVDLDGTTGFASSFLSEAFGLLSEKYTPKTVLDNIDIVSMEEPDWKHIILQTYIPNAIKRKRRKIKQ